MTEQLIPIVLGTCLISFCLWLLIWHFWKRKTDSNYYQSSIQGVNWEFLPKSTRILAVVFFGLVLVWLTTLFFMG
ncbi:hypothetical protein KC921_02445 [Candidatus Woesebacteria bacterium]|nr:hypothetical protein [Candidatus Woesebacteria bacterium]